MKKASVSETKNRLSAILDQVKEGETYVITEHGKPVARLEPIRGGESRADDDAHLADLERRGIIRRGRKRLSKELLESRPIKLPKGMSVLEALLEERRSGR